MSNVQCPLVIGNWNLVILSEIFLYNYFMITAMPRHMIERIRFVAIAGVISFLFAYFVDQYYILEKGWSFLLELVN